MSGHRIALLWLRRDLRLTDNPALRHALAHADQVIPVFIHAPDEKRPGDPARQAAGGCITAWRRSPKICASAPAAWCSGSARLYRRFAP
jgi:deoxyribodipyrimidine photo-lyase